MQVDSHSLRGSIIFAAIVWLAAAKAGGVYEVTPLRISMKPAATVLGLDDSGNAMLRTGLARYCLTKADGQPDEAVPYELESNGFNGSIPVASRSASGAACFEAIGGMAKTCAPADTSCLQKLPKFEYTFVYPMSTETREVIAVEPGTPKKSQVLILGVTTFCGNELARVQVCSTGLTRLAKIEAQIDPPPASYESYEIGPAEAPPADEDGPCVVVKARGSGRFIGNAKLFPGNVMKIPRCEIYQGGKLRLNLTFSKLQQP